jgi:transposase
MIPHGVEIFVGLEPIDLRWGFDRLCGTAQERVGRNGRCGALFVFFVSAVRPPFLTGVNGVS